MALLIRAYVFFNLFILGFYDNNDFIRDGYIYLPSGLDQFEVCDNELPEFYEFEFYKIIKSIDNVIISIHIKNNLNNCGCKFCHNAEIHFTTTQLTKEQLQDVKYFCEMLFRSLYLIYRDYPYDYDRILRTISYYFNRVLPN